MSEVGFNILELEDVIVCPNCARANDINRRYCEKCGTAIASQPHYDYLGAIYIEGDTYRKAIANPRQLIIVLGMWLILGPQFFSLAALILVPLSFWQSWGPFDVGGFLAASVLALGAMAYLTATGSILYRVTRNYVALKRALQPQELPRQR